MRRRNTSVAVDDWQAFCLDQPAWDEFVETLDWPARPIPELARLLSSPSVFDA